MITRRQMLKLSGGVAVTLILPACSANSLPLTASGIPKLTKQPPGKSVRISDFAETGIYLSSGSRRQNSARIARHTLSQRAGII